MGSPKSSDKCPTCNNSKNASARRDQQQVMISCDCCEKWFHNQCQNLTEQEANLVGKGASRGIKWFCNRCNPSLMIMANDDKTQKKSTEEKIDFIAICVKNLNEKISQPLLNGNSASNIQPPIDEQPYYKALMTNIDNINKAVSDNKENINQSKNILQQTLDQSDAEIRKLNAVLYGLEEKEDQKTSDLINAFMNAECMTKSPSPVSAFRLGNKKDSGPPRPIKMKFNDEGSKWEF